MLSWRYLSPKYLALAYSCREATIGAEALNCRVRYGIGCFHFAWSTRYSGLKLYLSLLSEIFSNALLYQWILLQYSSLLTVFRYDRSHKQGKTKIKLYEFISITRLNTSLCFHLWPINLVIFQEILYEQAHKNCLILGLASRLDAFSGYPTRT